MPDKVKYVTQLNGGLRLDVPSTLMQGQFSTDMSNIKVKRNGITGRNGYETIGTSLPFNTPITTIKQFTSYDETIHTVAFTHDDILALDNSTKEWSSILGDANWSSGYEAPALTAFINNTLIATNYNNEMIEWDGKSDSVSTLSNASTYRAKDLAPYQYRMMYANMVEDSNVVPQRVRWTAIGTYDDFSSGYAGFVDLVDTAGSILALEPLGENVVVYKDDSIVVASYVGGKNVYSFNTVVNSVGLIAPRAVVNLGDRHLFLSHDNVYEFTGNRGLQPVANAVQNELPRAVSSNNIQNSLATRYGDEAWFIVPMESQVPDTAYVYNWREDYWYKYKISTTGIGTYVDSEIVSIGDLEGDIGDLSGRIGDLDGVSIRPRIVLGDTDGYVYQMSSTTSSDEGDEIRNYWDSKDFVLGEDYKTHYNRFRSIEFDAKGDSIEVLYSTDSGDTWNYIGKKTLSNEYEWYKLWFDDTARKIRIRFRNFDNNESFSLRTFKIMYREGATR